ncbi:membrane protein of ER body-like protein isoform X1 [Capsicum galapagoense]
MAAEVSTPHNWSEMVPEMVIEEEETLEEALIGRGARRTANDDGDAVINGDDLSIGVEEEANKDKPKNSANFDNNEGIESLATNVRTVDFQKVLNVVVNPHHETGNINGESLSGVCLPSSRGQNETGNTKGDILSGVSLPPSLGHDSQSSGSVRKGRENERIIEEVEEEVVELEFFDTTAVDKLHTHNAYCPKCSSRITKVVLRRVKRERRISIEIGDRHDLLGCLSCFSVFIRIGKKLNPFPIFGSGGTNSTEIAGEPDLSNTNSVPSGSATVVGKPVTNEDGCFDLHWFFRKRREQDNGKKLTEPDLNQANNITDLGSPHNPCETSDGQNGHPFPNRGVPATKDNATDHKPPSPKKTLGTPPAKGSIHPGSLFDLGEEGGFIPGPMPYKKSPSQIKENKGDDSRIPMEDPRASPSSVHSSNTQRPVLSVEVKDSKSLEIVKCMVYGGLIESITSLGVVSSAAASDADTMKIVTLGVANLIGGLFVICQNLVDLKYSVGGGSNLRDQVDQYGELLGQRKHFLLHATFALLSYFVFGLVPPVIYGFTFRKSNDKDYKLIAVAAASLLCVILLAAAKAYTRGANKFGKYFKTIVSYVIAAFMASGVGYAAGHLIKRLMDDFGWFDSKPAPSFFSPEMISQNPAWASN